MKNANSVKTTAVNFSVNGGLVVYSYYRNKIDKPIWWCPINVGTTIRSKTGRYVKSVLTFTSLRVVVATYPNHGTAHLQGPSVFGHFWVHIGSIGGHPSVNLNIF